MSISSWQIEFARPLWFALLAALPLLLIFWRRTLLHFSLGRKIVSLLLRSLLLLLVATGLAGPKATGLGDLSVLVTKRNTLPVVVRLPSVVMTAPDHVRAGAPFSVEVLLRSKTASTATVELLRDSQPLLKETMSLVVGENHKIFSDIVLRPSRVVYSIRVKDEQCTWFDDNESACAIYVDSPPRVLLVESQPLLAEHLKKSLAGENVAVEVQPELPVGQLAAYDLIILSNVPAAALPESRMKALQTFVHDDRGGLIVVGGDRSFTAGGYRHTTLEEILPVISEERKNKPKRTLAMVLVLDISGSMNDPIAGNAKVRNIDLAKVALRTAVRKLHPRDLVGVLVFEDRSRWIWPLGPVTDKEKIIAKIDTIQAEGSTNMYRPLEQAYLSLREAFADLKHIIVTTDGLGEPGDFDGLAQKMAAAGITMTTVGVGSEPAQPFLQSIADKAKGRAYFCADAEKVPRIFETDTGVAAKIGITEEPFFPQVLHATQVLRGLDMSQAPTLLGYVETLARPESHVVLTSKTGEPILALRQYGGGTVAAFTSDIQSRWAAPWLNWSGFGKFWVQLVRQTMRHDVPKTLQFDADAADGRLFFTLDACDRDGRFINGAEARVTVGVSPLLPSGKGRGEGGESHSAVPLTQIAPGRYAGSQAAVEGTYWLEGQVRRDGKMIDSVRNGMVVLHTPEIAAKVDGPVEPTEKTGLRSIFLWPWLLAAGLVVLAIDLAVRRTGKAVK